MTVCVLGSINLDSVLRVARLPVAGETVQASSLTNFPGGKGANQAIAASRLGAEVAMIGALGRDEAGDAMLATLAEAGVDLAHVMRI